jgi:Ca-activated chloride channel family protein
VSYAYVGAGTKNRTWTVTAPQTPGTYEFRLFLNNGYVQAAVSAPVTVVGSAPPPTPPEPPPAPVATLTPSATSVAAGAPVTVTLANSPGGSTDWLAFAAVGSGATSYVSYAYVGAGTKNRTWTVTAPQTPGTYEFRLFLNNGYVQAAVSVPVTVQ